MNKINNILTASALGVSIILGIYVVDSNMKSQSSNEEILDEIKQGNKIISKTHDSTFYEPLFGTPDHMMLTYPWDANTAKIVDDEITKISFSKHFSLDMSYLGNNDLQISIIDATKSSRTNLISQICNHVVDFEVNQAFGSVFFKSDEVTEIQIPVSVYYDVDIKKPYDKDTLVDDDFIQTLNFEGGLPPYQSEVLPIHEFVLNNDPKDYVGAIEYHLEVYDANTKKTINLNSTQFVYILLDEKTSQSHQDCSDKESLKIIDELYGNS